jgi:hypothetical protein
VAVATTVATTVAVGTAGVAAAHVTASIVTAPVTGRATGHQGGHEGQTGQEGTHGELQSREGVRKATLWTSAFEVRCPASFAVRRDDPEHTRIRRFGSGFAILRNRPPAAGGGPEGIAVRGVRHRLVA